MSLKETIKKVLREDINTKCDMCNGMTINTYEDGLRILKNCLGSPSENPSDWEKIKKPLSFWRETTLQVRHEVETMGMSGDSEFDESNTWWSAIQSTFCK